MPARPTNPAKAVAWGARPELEEDLDPPAAADDAGGEAVEAAEDAPADAVEAADDAPEAAVAEPEASCGC